VKIVDTTDTAPGHGDFTNFNNPLVSESNVAFTGSYTGGSGLYVEIGGAGGTLTPLLNTGDALFGSTVSSIFLGSLGYDNNTLAFQYSLANGHSGIATTYLSAVPEPTSFALAALGLVGLGVIARRKKYCRA
jgi:hypothetical protein